MNDTKFQIDQKIVYPSHGVGIITDVFEKAFRGEPMLYYKIYIESSDMIVMVPVEKAEELEYVPSFPQKKLSRHLICFQMILSRLHQTGNYAIR